MPSSATTSLRLEKQFTGENVNSWGERLNTNFDLLDQAIAGLVTVALTGNVTLSSTNYATDQARYGAIKFTGTGSYVVTIPSVAKQYRIWNATTGSVTLTTGAGDSVVIAASDIVSVFCDGSNVKADGYGGVSLKDYIDSVVVGGGASLPSLTANSGKWLTNNGSIAQWAYPTTSSLSDIETYTASRTAEAIAFSIAF